MRMLTRTARGSAARRRRGSGPMAPAPRCPEGCEVLEPRACAVDERQRDREVRSALHASGPRGTPVRCERPSRSRTPTRSHRDSGCARRPSPCPGRRGDGGGPAHAPVGRRTPRPPRCRSRRARGRDDVLRRAGGARPRASRSGHVDRVARAVTVDRQLDQRAGRHEGASRRTASAHVSNVRATSSPSRAHVRIWPTGTVAVILSVPPTIGSR